MKSQEGITAVEHAERGAYLKVGDKMITWASHDHMVECLARLKFRGWGLPISRYFPVMFSPLLAGDDSVFYFM